MRRGTTPPVTLDVDTDLRTATQVWVTLEDMRGGEVTVELDELTVTEDSISFVLTQEQTLSLGAGRLRLQVRALLADGSAIASDEVACTLKGVLKEGVISADQIP